VEDWWSQRMVTATCISNDVETRAVLFQTRLPSPPQGFPITYAVDGRQYLAVPVGGGRQVGAPNAMFVFTLPEEGSEEP